MKDLRDRLAKLYADERLVRMIVRDAGLSEARIDLRGSPELMWWAVLEEAEKQGRLAALVARAREGYPHDPQLRAHNPSAPVAKAPVPARTLSVTQRQRLVCGLVARCDDMKTVREEAKGLRVAAPAGSDAGSAWVAVVQELHLRDLNAAPLLALCPEDG